LKNNNSKINNGCLNIFRFLKLLYDDKADYCSVYNIFKSDIIDDDSKIQDEKKLNNLIQVIINKYINSLKVFGIKIKKEKHKYKLNSSLYSIEYTLKDIKALSILLSAGNNIPDENLNKDMKNLKENMLLRMNNSDKNTLNSLISDRDFSFFYTDLKAQIKQCKEYCSDNVILNLMYLHRNKEIRIKCKPKEITYDVKTPYLNVYDINKKENIEIALPNILSMEVMPNRTASKIENTTTVVYKLKGRLAKIYKLKEGEKLGEAGQDFITVINSGEPFDKLFARLMRYAELCEIISPKYIRAEMINLINETIKLYKEK